MNKVLFTFALVSCASAFSLVCRRSGSAAVHNLSVRMSTGSNDNMQKFDPFFLTKESSEVSSPKIGAVAFASLVPLLFPLEGALAKDGEYGILEGRTASLMHPFFMLCLFLTSIYSASLGLKWRQLRELGEVDTLLSCLFVCLHFLRHNHCCLVSSGNQEYPGPPTSTLLWACKIPHRRQHRPD